MPVPQSLSSHPLVENAGMKITRHLGNKNSLTPALYFVGSLSSSPQLTSAIDEHVLDPFLWQLTQCYRDIYGGTPWNEYLICTNSECGHTFSISEIYKNQEYIPLYVLENSTPLTPRTLSCRHCTAPLEFFYPPRDFVGQLRLAFRKQIIATFLFDDILQLLGFSLGWETTIQQGWQDKFLRGYGDKQQALNTPYFDYLAEVQKHIGPEVQENSRAFNSAEWAVSISGRARGASLPLYYANLLTAFRAMSTAGEDIPVIGHTLLGSKALEIFSAIGFVHGTKVPGSEQVRVYSTLKNLLQGVCYVSKRKKK